MAFGTDINTIITGDSSLNTSTEGIYYENLPANFDLTKDWIVYSFKRTEQQDCLESKNIFQKYNITVRIYSTNTLVRESLGNYTIDLLNGSSSGNIQDIWFTGSSPATYLEKNVYIDELSFESFYF